MQKRAKGAEVGTSSIAGYAQKSINYFLDSNVVRILSVSLFGCFFLLAGCSTPMSVKQIQSYQSNCSNVASHIKELEKEKKENNHRGLAGVRSVMPASAVVNIVRGQYKTNAQIATGEWAKAVDKKLKELKKMQKSCPNSGA